MDFLVQIIFLACHFYNVTIDGKKCLSVKQIIQLTT
jgi:hypothetical protein